MQNTGLMRRIAAMLYDSLLVVALLFLATTPFIAWYGGEAVEPGENLLYQLVLSAVLFGFYVGFWKHRGRTLGMQSWGLQLESQDGQPLKMQQLVIRFFASILSWLPFGLGYLWSLWDKDKLAWHDRLSGTKIVHYPRPKKS
jgi:uncharacterized RDD family membrane protein YckC